MRHLIWDLDFLPGQLARLVDLASPRSLLCIDQITDLAEMRSLLALLAFFPDGHVTLSLVSYPSFLSLCVHFIVS